MKSERVTDDQLKIEYRQAKQDSTYLIWGSVFGIVISGVFLKIPESQALSITGAGFAIVSGLLARQENNKMINLKKKIKRI